MAAKPKHRLIGSDGLIAIALTLLGLAVRWPYFALIPLFTDETREALWAMQVWPGRQFLLTGVADYLGPLFSYLLAPLYFLFGLDPVLPRALVMALAAVTVGLTYWLARLLGLGRMGSVLAALLVLANPHHIVVSSHIGITNATSSFFVTALLIVLALVVKRNDPRWLLAAGLMVGLALQSHPVVWLILPGLILWYRIEPSTRRYWRTPWPYLAVLIAVATYGTVLVSMLQTGLFAVEQAQYIWQQDPTLVTYAQNVQRLTFQFLRVAGGSLEGAEQVSTLLGAPLFYVAWLIAGLIVAIRARFRLLWLVVASVWLIMPALSDHYGVLLPTRLTNHLTPLFAVMMGGAAEAFVAWVRRRWPVRDLDKSKARVAAMCAAAFLVAASLYPLAPLAKYYESKIGAGETNAEFFSFADSLQTAHDDSPVYVSESLRDIWLGGGGTVAYVMDLFLTMDQIPHETLLPQHILERLLTRPGRALLVLHARDLDLLQPFVSPTPLPGDAHLRAARRGYGLYVVEAGARIDKPDFVFSSDSSLARPPQQIVKADFERQVELLGFDLETDPVRSGDTLHLRIYWRALQRMERVRTGFVHLLGDINPSSGNLLWGQDDHELGRGLYRSVIWEPGEVVVEEYTIPVPPETPPGRYVIEAGVYDSLSLQRLNRLDDSGHAADDKVILAEVAISR